MNCIYRHFNLCLSAFEELLKELCRISGMSALSITAEGKGGVAQPEPRAPELLWVWNHSSISSLLLWVGFIDGTGKPVHSSSISVFPFHHQLSLLHLWKSSLLRKASKSTQMSSTTQTTWKPPGITSKPPKNICKASGALFLVTVCPKLNIRAWAHKFFRHLWIFLSKGWNPQFTLILEHVWEFQNEKSCYFYCRIIYKWSSLPE